MLRILLVLSLFSLAASADTVTSEFAGIVRHRPLPQSDTWFSLPFHRAALFEGNVTEVQGSALVFSNDLSPHLNGSPSCYLLVCTGMLEGATFAVSSHSGSFLTVQSNGVDLNLISPGTMARVIPHWTFESLFPNGTGATGTSSHTSRSTEILLFSGAEAGVNYSASSVYYYFTGTGRGWRKVGGGLSTNRGNDIIPPGAVLIYRQNTAMANEFASSGAVQLSGVAHWLPGRQPAIKQDHLMGLPVAASLTLEEGGFFENGCFAGSSSHSIRTDELLVFDNDVAAKNRSPAATYYYYTGSTPGWRKIGGGLGTVRNEEIVFRPGQALIIRKAPATSSVLYQTVPSYLE